MDDESFFVRCKYEKLLINMLDYIIKNKEKSITIKVNSKDFSLCKILKEKSFVREYKDESVLQINLKRDFNYEIPNEYSISPPDFKSDNWKYQLVIHKGFNHEGVPPKKEKWFFDPTPNFNNSLKVFVLYGEDYCAHCGVWYTQGETAYIEPVVTIPQHRKRGLAKAVVYEAINRAKELGAKRAIVLSEQEFYFRIGFDLSSEFYVWKRQ